MKCFPLRRLLNIAVEEIALADEDQAPRPMVGIKQAVIELDITAIYRACTDTRRSTTEPNP